MEKVAYIEIRINGTKGNLDLSPDTYDIREIISMLENTEQMLFPGDKKSRPTISYRMDEGSVRHIFKTSIQFIIGFNAIIGQINQSGNIDFLDLPTANAIENIQEIATSRDYSISISSSLENTNILQIDSKTKYIRTETIWADAEFYFYGKVTNAGGKNKANIHISTDEMGILRIETPISFLEDYEDNLLYKTFGIRAIGRQHSETGEIDTSSLVFKELIQYTHEYDTPYLNLLREKAKKSWLSKVDLGNWLEEIRDSYAE